MKGKRKKGLMGARAYSGEKGRTQYSFPFLEAGGGGGGEGLETGTGSVEKRQVAARPRKSISARKLGANLWEVQDLLPMSWMSRNSSRPRRREARRERCRNDLTPLAPEERPQSAGSLRKHVVAASIEHRKSNVRENAAAFRKSMEVASKRIIGQRIESRVGTCKCTYSGAVKEQKTHHCEMEDLVNQIADGKLVRKGKEHGRTMAAVQSIREELDDERRLRRRSESLHRKLGKELYETKTTLSKAVKDLESEIKSRYLLEDLL
ncbi:hypothetical protein HPP92_002477 [Vanilla planifolia]|uniref:Uncharacterized protein n=1 Tax=Vanilla planifolia TaxID=51239 RepID=A0A835VME5_VANPL|nr:hypothetical protein HPP92_002477 [Vanilla planifolia]